MKPAERSGSDRARLVEPVLSFLHCRTPQAWVDAAVADLPTLLVDHASLELRAAQQAQALIVRYGTVGSPLRGASEDSRLALMRKLARLAREELRHFEQVVEQLATRGIAYDPIPASRYARELHAQLRKNEPGRCVDTLIIGAIIEARSCERFYALLPSLGKSAPELADFYASLLRAEARHFEDYLRLADAFSGEDRSARTQFFLELDAALTVTPDRELRFHSGPPV